MTEWPDQPEIVERIPLKTCVRRGAAIDVVADRGREHRSQIVFTRGREMVFWQLPRTRKQARPMCDCPPSEPPVSSSWRSWSTRTSATPTSSPASRSPPCGEAWRAGLRDHPGREDRRRGRTQVLARSGLQPDQRSAAVRSRRTRHPAPRGRRGRGPLLAGLHPRPVRPATVADGLAELQVRYPSIPIVFCETRKLAEEWTYRYLAAAHTWAQTDTVALQRIGLIAETPVETVPDDDTTAAPSTAEIRTWARANGITVPDRGRLRPEIHQAWRDAHPR